MRMRWCAMVLAVMVAPLAGTAQGETLGLFQFFAFSSEDLELTPGPTMSLHGRIHANRDLYLSSNTTLRLGHVPNTMVSPVQVTAGRDVYRGQKIVQVFPRCSGTVMIERRDFTPLAMTCTSSTTLRLMTPDSLAPWDGTVAGQRPYAAVPTPALITRAGPYWHHADLRIVLRADRPRPYPIEVHDADGTLDVTRTALLQTFVHDAAWNRGDVAGMGPSSVPGTAPVFYTDVPSSAPGCGCAPGVPTCGHTDPGCYDPPFGPPLAGDTTRVYGRTMFDGDARRGGFWDYRERTWLLLLNVNVTDLLAWNADHGDPFFPSDDTTDGGIVLYLAIVGPDADGINGHGARVFGSGNIELPGGGIGATADPTGIAVVSDQALFVLGDFNRGPSATVELSRQPAAVIGDTVNVLSNRYWDGACSGSSCRDGQSPLPLNATAREARSTRINAAVLGGMDATIPGSATGFGGGVQSLPRLHERWASWTLYLRGSLVALGPPVHKAGPWCGTGGGPTGGCNIYDAPLRNWDYDAGFENPLALPPLTPMLGCGNGIVELDEECDDGNAGGDDCCMPFCRVLPEGFPCQDDGSACSTDACDAAGTCVHTPANAGAVCRDAAGACDVAERCDGITPNCPADQAVQDGTPCDDGDVCTLADACAGGVCASGGPDACDDHDPCTADACAVAVGCTHDASPRASCRSAEASTFVLTRREGASRVLRWTWSRGTSTAAAAYGDPTASTGIGLCVYDATGIVLRAHVPPGTLRWRAVGAGGYRYRDATTSADGVSKLHLVASDRDRAQITLAGKGPSLPDAPSGPLHPPVIVQLHRDDADVCWTQSFDGGDLRRNDEQQTKARVP